MKHSRLINAGAAAALLVVFVSLYAWGYSVRSTRTRLAIGTVATKPKTHEGRAFRSKWEALFFAPALAIESAWAHEKIYPAWREP